VIGTIWDASLEQSLGVNRENARKVAVGEIEHALDGHPRQAEILEGFWALQPDAVAPNSHN
jgi:hypothetical protein